jgi:antitoxin PrlF
MKEIPSTITSKGQVTIPAEVRKHLGLKQGDKVAFVLDDAGKVELKAPKYPTVASLAGAAGTLSKPRNIEEMLAIAREDALEEEYRPTT